MTIDTNKLKNINLDARNLLVMNSILLYKKKIQGTLDAHDKELASLQGTMNAHDKGLASLQGTMNAHDKGLASLQRTVDAHDKEKKLRYKVTHTTEKLT